jgi:vacuolar-type H+-ATPase subunit H
MEEKAIQDMSKVKEDLCKSIDTKQSNTFDVIIQETKRYIEEIQNLQAARNGDAQDQVIGE